MYIVRTAQLSRDINGSVFKLGRQPQQESAQYKLFQALTSLLSIFA
jgi:hypothetical protein